MKKMSEVITYIENHIHEEIEYCVLANIAGYSIFYFHRIFTMLFGLTIGEYIRYRRLSLAAKEIRETNMSILNIAYHFQYQTPEGFTKAFRKFHGCSPLQMRKRKLKGNQYDILCFEDIVIEKDLYYIVRDEPAFALQLIKKSFLNDNSTFTIEIQEYWKELKVKQEYKDLMTRNNPVVFKDTVHIAVDMKQDNDAEYFEYGVGLEVANKEEATLLVPASSWLVFPCIGPVNTSMIKTWRQVYYYFIKERQWQPRFDFNLEVYYPGDRNRSDYKCEVWFPVWKDKNV